VTTHFSCWKGGIPAGMEDFHAGVEMLKSGLSERKLGEFLFSKLFLRDIHYMEKAMFELTGAVLGGD
jgi:hypothetical protein